jgi:glutamyl-tRNA synthetase
VEKERLTRFDEIPEKIAEYQALPSYESSLLVWKKSDAMDAMHHLKALKNMCELWTKDTWLDLGLIETSVRRYIDDNVLPNGNVLWPLRVALSGKEHSPSPFELLWVLGKEETLARLQKALQKLSA